MCPREKGFVLWGHCQNLLDDPRRMVFVVNCFFFFEFLFASFLLYLT